MKTKTLFNELDSTSISELYTIIGNPDGRAEAYARNLLIFNNKLNYSEPKVFPDLNSTDKSLPSEYAFDKYIDNGNDYLNIYPNPANNFIVVEYFSDSFYNNISLSIYSINGSKVGSNYISPEKPIAIVDIQDYKKGTYIIKASTGENTICSQKFIKY